MRVETGFGRGVAAGFALFAALFLMFACGGAADAASMGEGASRIERATVFLSGAEITRVMRVDLKPGKNTVTFGGLPTDIRPESVGARVADESNGAALLSAVFRVDHLAKPGASERVKRLNDELKTVRDDIERNADRVRVLDAEEAFLGKNSAIGGKIGVRFEELRSVDEYYRARLAEIASEKFDCKCEAEVL